MKKVAVILIFAALLCSMQTASAEWSWESAAAPYKGQTIYVLLQTHPATDATAPLIEEFEKMTGINVEMELLQRRAMNTREEMELSASKGAYDVTHNAPPKRVRYARANWAAPLNGFIKNSDLTSPDFNLDDFVPAYLDMLKIDETIYGLPFSGETNLLYYRTDIFEEHGIAGPPQTIDELEEIAAKIDTEDIPAFVTRAVKGQGINVYTWATFLRSYGGDFFDQDLKPTLDTPEAILATEKYAEILQNYGPFGVSGYSHYECTTDFSQGKVAMFLGAGPWGASVFNDPAKSKIIGKWMAAQVPAGPEGRFTDAYTHGMMIPANAANKEAAWLFIQWYTSTETQLARAVKEGGDGSVTRISVFNDPDYQEWYKKGNWAAAQLEAVEKYGAELRPNSLPEWLEVGDRIGAAVQQVIAGEATAEEAMTAANEDVYQIMQEAGYY
ncbi:extracellular solute-binding protein [candidate division KSB3 bacterium]|uniref:Extracellular solute-binding protein n=1 Tax=candidate division KSB3 bacterium TaxID=2044937 RepID=A0A9D5Q416_9BACT|nr:extracellular solute-binding protein [candidate division KSB3 bacterium]MBD3323085.1 extracellular solute-binding protein [candidate division KSB3 bacterium]